MSGRAFLIPAVLKLFYASGPDLASYKALAIGRFDATLLGRDKETVARIVRDRSGHPAGMREGSQGQAKRSPWS